MGPENLIFLPLMLNPQLYPAQAYTHLIHTVGVLAPWLSGASRAGATVVSHHGRVASVWPHCSRPCNGRAEIRCQQFCLRVHSDHLNAFTGYLRLSCSPTRRAIQVLASEWLAYGKLFQSCSVHFGLTFLFRKSISLSTIH